MSERTVHVEIRGRVQGVGYRWFVHARATELGLRGWVRNREDGAVELAAAGPAASIERLLEAVRRAPTGAREDAERELPPSPFGAVPDFAILS